MADAPPTRQFRGPDDVLLWLEHAIDNCWIEIATENKNLAGLEREMKLLMDSTIENLHARPQAFGISGGPPDDSAADFRLAQFKGPAALMFLHLAVEMCHQMLPVEERNVGSVERAVRSFFEQSLARARSDPGDFGQCGKIALTWLSSAISCCWREITAQDKNLATLEREMKLLMDITIENLYARPQAFEISGAPPDDGAADFRNARIDGTDALMCLHSAVETCGMMILAEPHNVDSVARVVRDLFDQSLLRLRSHPAEFIKWH